MLHCLPHRRRGQPHFRYFGSNFNKSTHGGRTRGNLMVLVQEGSLSRTSLTLESLLFTVRDSQ